MCHRSTTTCATCRHFRKAVTLKLGYCALDRSRSPLTGDEQRACWERPDAEPGSAEIERFGSGSGPDGPPVVPFGLWGAPEAAPETGNLPSRR